MRPLPTAQLLLILLLLLLAGASAGCRRFCFFINVFVIYVSAIIFIATIANRIIAANIWLFLLLLAGAGRQFFFLVKILPEAKKQWTLQKKLKKKSKSAGK